MNSIHYPPTGKSQNSTPQSFVLSPRLPDAEHCPSKQDNMQIYLSQVIAAYRASGLSGHSPFFDLTYRKAGGAFGRKTSVRRRAGETLAKKDLTSIQHENRQAGKLHLIDQNQNQFELHIPLLVCFNGKLIDHRF